MGTELFHAEGRTDRRTDMTKLIVAFRNFASAPKTDTSSMSLVLTRSFTRAANLTVKTAHWVRQVLLSEVKEYVTCRQLNPYVRMQTNSKHTKLNTDYQLDGHIANTTCNSESKC